MKTIQLLILFCIGISSITAQKLTINGKVTDRSGLPLPGVNILIKGTQTGTQTDFDGIYTIQAEIRDVLSFSYVGFETKEIKIKKRQTEINIQLEEDNAVLEEVVVTGYSTSHQSSRRMITTSKIKTNLAGVKVPKAIRNTTNGIKIRGVSSTSASNNPLYIVDGVPISNADIDLIKKIPSTEISKLKVYKANKAESIFGTKANQGCIVITTKAGNYRVNQDESYKEIVENKFEHTKTAPLSTFSIDVDKAAYSNIRRMINNGTKIPVDAVKIEEMINYFDYDYSQPKGDHPFAIHTELGASPWNPKHKLVKIGIKGKEFAQDDIPPSNLVFLIDVSGSMSDHNKLPLLKKAFKLLVNQLREKDKVSIVVYAGAAGMVLNPTSGAFKNKINQALENLEAGGSTAGGAGIELAYKIAKESFIKNGNNRVILATDGDFNVGISSDKEMEELIKEKRESGVFLTCLGFGMGNYKDSKLETLADKGNGNHAYIDTMQEAQHVLGTEFGGTLYTIAKDVKIQVEFNPKRVQAYRLIGYENRLLNDEDFIDDTKDAGELGSGHTVTALYEVIPKGIESSFLPKLPPLKYSKTINTTEEAIKDELLTVKFRYKKPSGTKSIEMSHILQATDDLEISSDFNFIASVAWFGLKLRKSDYIENEDIEQIISLAENHKSNDPNGYKSEFVRLLRSYQNF